MPKVEITRHKFRERPPCLRQSILRKDFTGGDVALRPEERSRAVGVHSCRNRDVVLHIVLVLHRAGLAVRRVINFQLHSLSRSVITRHPRHREVVGRTRAVVEHAAPVLHAGARGPDFDRGVARRNDALAEVERTCGIPVARHHDLAVLEREGRILRRNRRGVGRAALGIREAAVSEAPAVGQRSQRLAVVGGG